MADSGFKLPSNKSTTVNGDLNKGGIDSIYKTGTSLRHKRHRQRLHGDWKLNQSVEINSDKTSTTPKVKL